MANLGGIFSSGFTRGATVAQSQNEVRSKQAAAKKQAYVDSIKSTIASFGSEIKRGVTELHQFHLVQGTDDKQRLVETGKLIQGSKQTLLPRLKSAIDTGVKAGVLSGAEASQLLAEAEGSLTPVNEEFTKELQKYQDKQKELAAETSPENIAGQAAKAGAITTATQAATPSSKQTRMIIDPKEGKIVGMGRFDPKTGLTTFEDGTPIPEGAISVNPQFEATDVSDLTTKTKGDLEGKVIGGKDQIARLEKLVQTFDPNLLTLSADVQEKILATGEYLGAKLTDEQKEFLTRKSTYKQDAIEVVNRGIKEMTGAQMSEPEAKRLRKQFADVENDSPTQFISKVKNGLATMKMATARHQYMLDHGVSTEVGADGEYSISIDRFKEIVQKRGEALAVEYEAQGMSAEQAQQKALGDIRREFKL